MRAWLVDRARDLAPRTLKSHAESLEFFADYLAEREPGRSWYIEDMARDLLSGFFAWLLEPRTWSAGRIRSGEKQRKQARARLPLTAAKRVVSVQLVWEWAFRDSETYEEITPKPRKIKLPQQTRSHKVSSSFAEYDAMLRALSTGQKAHEREWARRAALIARYTGCRRMAALCLRWSDVDFVRGIVHFAEQYAKEDATTIPLHPDLAARMESWRSAGSTVCDAPEAQRESRGHIDRVLRRAWRRAGVPEDRWRGQPMHVARAMIETELARAKVQQQIIDLYLGHVTPGSGPKNYTDRVRLWPELSECLKHIPAADLVERAGTVVAFGEGR